MGDRRKVKVGVTKQDVEIGEVGDCTDCPVALAIKRALSLYEGYGYGSVGVSVDGDQAWLVLPTGDNESRQSWQADLPKKARSRIDDYDYNGEMRPFSFMLEYERSAD